MSARFKNIPYVCEECGGEDSSVRARRSKVWTTSNISFGPMFFLFLILNIDLVFCLCRVWGIGNVCFQNLGGAMSQSNRSSLGSPCLPGSTTLPMPVKSALVKVLVCERGEAGKQGVDDYWS